MLRGHLLCIYSLITSLELAQEMFLGWKHLAKSVLKQLYTMYLLAVLVYFGLQQWLCQTVNVPRDICEDVHICPGRVFILPVEEEGEFCSVWAELQAAGGHDGREMMAPGGAEHSWRCCVQVQCWAALISIQADFLQTWDRTSSSIFCICLRHRLISLESI